MPQSKKDGSWQGEVYSRSYILNTFYSEFRFGRSENSIIEIDIEPELRESAADVEIKILITRDRQRAEQNRNGIAKQTKTSHRPKNPRKVASNRP